MAPNSKIASFDSTSPGTDLVPVTPSDNTDLTIEARSIRCRPDGTAETLRFTAHSGEVRNTAIAAGETLSVVAKRIHSTGTTATGLEVYI